MSATTAVYTWRLEEVIVFTSIRVVCIHFLDAMNGRIRGDELISKTLQVDPFHNSFAGAVEIWIRGCFDGIVDVDGLVEQFFNVWDVHARNVKPAVECGKMYSENKLSNDWEIND